MVISLFLILSFSSSSSAKVLDKIVAVVNDEVITQSEIDRILYPIYQQYKSIFKTEEELYKRLDEARRQILGQLINDTLILSEAKRLKITADEGEIDKQMGLVKEELRNRGMNLDDLLSEQNLTLSDLRNKYKEQIMIQKAIEQQVRSKVDIQPSDVSNFYLTHKGDYTQPEQVAAYTILIKLESVRTPLESHQLAADIHKMLLDGYDFKEAVRNYSEGPHKDEGGDLGYIKRGELLKEIDNVIFFLKVGELSNVIETPIGYHIFKVYDRIEEKILPFEEVRQKITETLYRIKAEEAFEDWIDSLKSNAYISIK